MPRVFRRPGSPYWYFRHADETGQIRWRSTKCTDESQAQDVCDDWLSERRGRDTVDGLMRRLVVVLESLPVHDRQERSRQCASELLRGDGVRLPMSHAWDAFCARPRRSRPGDALAKLYQVWWARFVGWVAANRPGVVLVEEVDGDSGRQIADEYAAYLWGMRTTPRTFNAQVRFLRLFFRTLKTAAGLRDNVWDQLELQHSETEGRRNLTEDELRLVCKRADGLRDTYPHLRYWIALGIYTGMRLKDVVTLSWDEVNVDAGYIDRVPAKTRRRTGGRAVKIPMHPVLQAMVRVLQGNEKRTGWVFPEHADGYEKKRIAISKEIQAFFHDVCRLQTTRPVAEGEHRKRAVVEVGFHSLRHSFVSLCAANRVPEVAIMDLVGHGSPAMTALYAHADERQKAAAIAGLPDVVSRRRRARS